MVHLAPLPGSPRFDGDLEAVTKRAVTDAVALAEAGFPALMVENFGDAPFFSEAVPPVTVAAMTRAVGAVIDHTHLPVGINVLRNDALAALGVAAATGASWIRVNVLSGVMYTDQGPVVGRAAAVVRHRAEICPQVAILADVFVKHAVAPAGLTIEQAGMDTWERGLADALIVSGPGTGMAPDLEQARRLRAALPQAPILIGSGASPSNLGLLATVADGAIAGTYLKQDGRTDRPVDTVRAAALVATARTIGWA